MTRELTLKVKKSKAIKRVLLSGGGTGGHIYPALALAEELKLQNPGIKIRFVGSYRGLESKIIPEKNYILYLLNIGPLHSSVGRLQQIKTIVLLPYVFIQCLWILLTFRPQRVVGFGGYASGPIVFVASALFFKTALWEANVQPGIANKILSRFVNRCYVVFEESLQFFPKFKTKCFGYPVRSEFDEYFKSHNSDINKKNLKNSFQVLVIGGSQGARILNELVPKVSQKLKSINFILQTGSKCFHDVAIQNDTSENSEKSVSNLTILPFLDPIFNFYLSADLIVSRSGAGALTELSSVGANCLFIPFAKSSDNHQLKNAQALSHREAAFLIQEKDINEKLLLKFLSDFQLTSESEREERSQKMFAFFKPKATFNIANDLSVC